MRNLIALATEVKQQVGLQLLLAEPIIRLQKINVGNIHHVITSRKIEVSYSEKAWLNCIPIDRLIALWIYEKWQQLERIDDNLTEVDIIEALRTFDGISYI